MDIFFLTPRQQEVVDLILAGRRQKSIACQLGISQTRVEQIVRTVARRIDPETESPSFTIQQHFRRGTAA